MFKKMKKLHLLSVLFVLVLGLALIFAASPAFADDGGRPFLTMLTGAAEVNSAGVPNQGDLDGSGAAYLTLNQGQEEICFEITVSGITLPAIGAHIHAAPAGSNGPVVVPLTPPDADGTSSGCVTVNPDLIKAIRQNPTDYYVNVHTNDFPAGALRGQLSK